MYRYIFGPVYSRRFGSSVGIDLSPYEKSCNFDCLYCELKKSKPVNTIKNEPNFEDVIYELKDFLEKNPFPDVITITANGEPTLYTKLDELVHNLNKIKGSSKLLILSNSSTIYKTEIQEILKNIDIVKLSLDSANPKVFKKIDRHLEDINLKDIIKGIKEFRKIYNKIFIIEVLLVKGVNDKSDDLEKLAKVLKDINPDRVDLGTIDRPPAYKVKSLSNEELLKASSYFKDLNINVVYRKEDKNKKFNYSKDQILTTLKRRPLTISDVDILFTDEAKNNFFNLIKEGKIKEKKVGNISFYMCQ